METFKFTNNNLTITLNNKLTYNRLDVAPTTQTDFNNFIKVYNKTFYLQK